MPGIEGKHIVVGVCGGIAAYKAAELVRLLVKQEALVRVLMTKNAEHFIGPITFEALSQQNVCADLFTNTDDASIGHIEWAQEADAVVVAPATANFIGKMAAGIADDALSTFLLAVTVPVLVCPAMNTQMFHSRALQRNLNILKDDGYLVLDPDQGDLACGTVGPGRLPDPEQILDRLIRAFSDKDLAGLHVMVTAGPTQEMVDPVRYISNPSTGKMGYALARAAEHRGATVTLISGPTHLPPPLNVEIVPIHSTLQMAQAVQAHLARSQVVIKAAAVSDYRPSTEAENKIKKTDGPMTLELIRNPDILKEIGRSKKGRIHVGFAAETQDLTKHATQKLKEKNLDMIVGNLIGSHDSGFGANTNRVTLFKSDGTVEPLPVMDKLAVAHVILDRISTLAGRKGLT